MNRVRKRAWIMLVFMGILLGGMGFFLYEYASFGASWSTLKGTTAVTGQVTDRQGVVLLDANNGYDYSDDALVRKATLHWLGDRQGNISTPALRTYSAALKGYDPINGTYSNADNRGVMELTISARVQTAALQAMNGRKGTVAVYNYKTGQILCAVSTPTFDPDNVPDIAGDTSGAWEGVYLNRFTQVTYPPGSIFKIITTAAALETVPGIEDMTFTCESVYEIQGGKVTCERAHGQVNLKNALAQSCNCAYAQIAQLVGSGNLQKYAEQFGILDSLSFDGITTAAGNFDLTGADKLGLAWSAIGQYTDMVNPCQYMTFMGSIAGGGSAAKPYLVEKVTSGSEVTYQGKPEMMDAVMDEELAAILAEYLRNNVQTIYGSGNFPGLTVCAKSGTSELGGGKKPNAMFAGFVADEQYPLAFIVVVENGGYGANTCVPILAPVLRECKAVLDGK